MVINKLVKRNLPGSPKKGQKNEMSFTTSTVGIYKVKHENTLTSRKKVYRSVMENNFF